MNRLEKSPVTVNEASSDNLKVISLTFLPASISKEMVKAAGDLVEGSNLVMKGFGDTYYVDNPKNKNMPFQVVADLRKETFACKSQSCYRFKSFGVCQHTLEIASKTHEPYLAKINKKGSVKVNCLADVGKEKNAGKKRSKATERRKGPSNKVPVPMKRLVLPSKCRRTDQSVDFVSPQSASSQQIEETVQGTIKSVHAHLIHHHTDTTSPS